MMSTTKFGKFMRIQRIKNNEVMSDTARLLNVTIPFVSAVENGKRNVPDGWLEILSDHYNLNLVEKEQLKALIDESKTQIKLPLQNATDYQKQAAFCFERSFDDIDAETAKAIIKLFDKKSEG